MSSLPDTHAALPTRQGGSLTGLRLDPQPALPLVCARRWLHRASMLLTGLALAATGCVGTPSPPPASPTLTSPSPAAPASPPASPALPPSPSPTPAAPVAVGELLYAEAFDNPEGWELEQTTTGAASILDGRLVLSVRKRAAALLQPAPAEPVGDFYTEVDLRPSVCSPGDEYGLAIRLTPSGGHYRVSLLCEGAVRLVRVVPDETRALTLVTPSDAIIPGAQGTNRLAVSAEGSQLRVFVNRQPVLEHRDTRLTFGGIGVFARTGTGGQTTVAFDNLGVYALAATPTPAP